MKIVFSSGTPDYYPLARKLEDNLNQLGYQYTVYDLVGQYGKGIPVPPLFGSVPERRREYLRCKPLCMAHARLNNTGPILWVDTDCIIRERLECVSGDVGLYFRQKGKSSVVKVDVVYMDDSPGAEQFVSLYASMPVYVRNDRRWLQTLFDEKKIHGIDIQMWSDVWSFDVTEAKELPDTVKVIHLKPDAIEDKLKLREYYADRYGM